MPIARRFQILLERITPGPVEQDDFERHRDTVRQRLEPLFNEPQFVPIGSVVRGSAVANSSDIDLLLSLRRDDIRWGGDFVYSDTLLNNVRNALQAKFPTSDVGRDGQAVAIRFSRDRRVEVVPGYFHSMSDRHPVYKIPDGNRGWMATSPGAHNRYILQEDARAGGKLKFVSMLLKFWRICRTSTIPLNSFHVDLLLAQEGTCVGAKGYAQCLHEAFSLMYRRECADLRDPIKISGLIPAANTGAKRYDLQSAVLHAVQHSESALCAESDRNSEEAIRQWDIVFNGNFPKR